MDLVDTHGPGALTMRRLADGFDTGPASLYRHVQSREHLLAEMLDVMLAGFTVQMPDDGRADTAIRAMAHDLRAALLSHPGVVALLGQSNASGTQILSRLDEACGVAERLGVPPADAGAIIATTYHVVFGFSVMQAAGQIPTDSSRDKWRLLFEAVPQETFPHLGAAAEHLVAQGADGEFALVVDLLAGAAQRAAVSGAPTR